VLPPPGGTPHGPETVVADLGGTLGRHPGRGHMHIDLLSEGDGEVTESLTDHLDRYARAQGGSSIAVPNVMWMSSVAPVSCGARRPWSE
jgi:hypothetical protein